MNVQQRVREFVLQNFYVSDPSEIADDTLLVTTGFIDSTGMLEMITFLEEEFRIRIADDETTAENLESIERMAAFVTKKQKNGSQANGLGATG
jgi:acyl carrier protein